MVRVKPALSLPPLLAHIPAQPNDPWGVREENSLFSVLSSARNTNKKVDCAHKLMILLMFTHNPVSKASIW